jgi:WD40 repeat protein/serine/threonine protein kinase
VTEREIFGIALQLTDAQERSRFLDEACGGDDALLRRIKNLLRNHERAGSFLERAPGDLGAALTESDSPASAGEPDAYSATMTTPTPTEGAGARIGPYKLLEQIGEGGMGVVYLAEQSAPIKRRVALKIIKPGMDTRQVLARFDAERQALALMDHPHIAKVLDAGSTEAGHPFFVMELVRGVPITDYCDDKQLTPRERLELFVPLCEAIQHAHQKGIIHRDIKPSNVLVTLHDDKPVLKVIDFGVAKATSGQLTDQTMFTGIAQMIGTPLYMSPEQAAQSGLDIDTRSDIYSLGVLLYELLTGTTPFDKDRLQKAAYDEIRRIIRDEEPQRPSMRLSSLGDTLPSVSAQRKMEPRKLSQFMQVDLDWIVMKALEKDRARRYETASSFAADVHRYLSGEPVLAVPPSAAYRLWKFASRHRAAMLTAAAIALLLSAAAAISIWQAFVATRASHEADRARRAAERARDAATLAEERQREIRLSAEADLYCAEMNLAGQALVEPKGLRRVVELIDRWQPKRVERDLRGWEWYYLQSISHPDTLNIRSVWPSVAKWSTDGKLMAVAALDGTSIRNGATGKALRPLVEPVGRLNDLAWDPSGKRLATASTAGQVCVWDVSTGAKISTLGELSGEAQGVAWSPDGTSIVATAKGATLGSSSVTLWTVADGKRLWALEHERTIYPFRCAFSPSGDFISAGNLVLSAKDGMVKHRIPVEVKGRADWSSDGQWLALPTGPSVDIVDPTSGKLVKQIQGHTDVVMAAAWSPDRRWIALASLDNTISLWDWQKNDLFVTLRGHLDHVDDLGWSPDGSQLASLSMREGVVRLWTFPPTPTPRTRKVGAYGCSLRWNRDGTRLACLSGTGLRIFDADLQRETLASAWPSSYGTGDRAIAWSPRGNQLAACQANTVVLMDHLGKELFRLPAQEKPLNAVAWNPRGDLLVATTNPGGGAGGFFVEADADTGAIASNKRHAVARYHFGHAVTFSPDGEQFVTSGWAGIRIWDARTKQVLGQYSDSSVTWVGSVEWNPKGKSIAFACYDRSIRIVDSAQYKLQHSLLGHTAEVQAISWSADGRRIASASADRTLIIWDAALASQVLTLRGHNSAVICVNWSPDGKRLASLDREGTLNVWDATPAFASARD